MRKIIVAIDGHSSCGKSTMAKHLSLKTGYTYIDTGAMYRAVTLFCIRNGIFITDGIDLASLSKEIKNLHISFKTDNNGKQLTLLNGEIVEKEIRGMDVSGKVSHVATVDFVRKAMVVLQRNMGKNRGVVMDGRDIGTVVFPDAELKIFVTASDEIRAKRRYNEMTSKGEKVNFTDILYNVRERDYIDSNRKISPLKQAEDALLFDNSNMTIEEQDEWLFTQFERAIAK